MSYTEIEGDISDVYNTANKQAPARVLTRLKTTHKAHPSPFGHWSASLKKKKKDSIDQPEKSLHGWRESTKRKKPNYSLVRTPRHLISILN
jgi:hypothetical protein